MNPLMVIGFISANGAFLLLTPLAIVWLIFMQTRSARAVAKNVDAVKKETAEAVEDAAEKVAAKLLIQTVANKKDLDEKLEVIHVNVNSNLTAALKEIQELKIRLGITEDKPEGTSRIVA